MKVTKHDRKLIAQLEQQYFEKTGCKINITPLDRWEEICWMPVRLGVGELVELICKKADWDIECIRNAKLRHRIYCEQRQYITFILIHNRFSHSEIAQYFNWDHHTPVRQLKKVEFRLSQTPSAVLQLKSISQDIKDDLISLL